MRCGVQKSIVIRISVDSISIEVFFCGMLLDAPNSDGSVATHHGLRYGYSEMTCASSYLLLHIVVSAWVDNEADPNTHRHPKKHAQLTDLYCTDQKVAVLISRYLRLRFLDTVMQKRKANPLTTNRWLSAFAIEGGRMGWTLYLRTRPKPS